MNNYDYNNEELDSDTQKMILEDAFQLVTSDKATEADFWEAFELDSVDSNMLEAISGNPLAPTDLLDAIAGELISRTTQNADMMLFDDEAIENVLNHSNTSEAKKEEVREYLASMADAE